MSDNNFIMFNEKITNIKEKLITLTTEFFNKHKKNAENTTFPILKLYRQIHNRLVVIIESLEAAQPSIQLADPGVQLVKPDILSNGFPPSFGFANKDIDNFLNVTVDDLMADKSEDKNQIS